MSVCWNYLHEPKVLAKLGAALHRFCARAGSQGFLSKHSRNG